MPSVSRRRLLPVLVATATLGSGVALLTPAADADGKLAFGHTVVIDPQRLGSEPIIKADPSGGLYASSIIGFSNSVSFLWKSQDHGKQWDLVNAFPNTIPAQRPSFTHGGGDSEIVIGPKAPGDAGYTVSFYDLESLADIGVATSFDSGKTFSIQNSNALGGDIAGTDRQWGQLWRDPQGKDHLFLVYNALQSQNGKGTILRESLDYGKTWKNMGSGGTLEGVFDSGALGQLRVDKAGNLFFTSENSPAVNLVRGMRQKDGRYTFSSTLVSSEPGTDTRQLFITSALDSAGNIYVVWSRRESKRTDVGIYTSVSRDHGRTFGAPVRMSTGGIKNANFPWIIAGDPGRVAVAFYGTKNKGDSTSNAGPWDVYVSQSTDFLSKHPHVEQAKVSEHPSHTNPICLSGLGCTAGSAHDRNLGDFFQLDMDPTDGSVIVLWADTANQYGALAGSAVNSYAKQVSGPSLLVKKKVRTAGFIDARNAVSDQKNDARLYGEGVSNPSMDLTRVAVKEVGDNLVITAKLKGSDLAQMLDPSVGPAATVVVSWWAGQKNSDNGDLGRVHFVGMQTQGITPVFFGGSPTYVNSSSGTSRFAEFVPGPLAPPANGTFDGGVVTWTISKSAAGLGGAFAPNKLFSVTGTTLQGMPVYTYNTAAH
ncbi:MAG: hypothetical protein M3P04_02550 [Actinomycetota bacterium]|nr:hypothetical protein [Actinomycetota bacterium]